MIIGPIFLIIMNFMQCNMLIVEYLQVSAVVRLCQMKEGSVIWSHFYLHSLF